MWTSESIENQDFITGKSPYPVPERKNYTREQNSYFLPLLIYSRKAFSREFTTLENMVLFNYIITKINYVLNTVLKSIFDCIPIIKK